MSQHGAHLCSRAPLPQGPPSSKPRRWARTSSQTGAGPGELPQALAFCAVVCRQITSGAFKASPGPAHRL